MSTLFGRRATPDERDELDALIAEGERLEAALGAIADPGVERPRQGEAADTARRAEGWMEAEESFRQAAGLRLGLRRWEHYDEVAYLNTVDAPGPDWRRLLIGRVGFRLARLHELRPGDR